MRCAAAVKTAFCYLFHTAIVFTFTKQSEKNPSILNPTKACVRAEAGLALFAVGVISVIRTAYIVWSEARSQRRFPSYFRASDFYIRCGPILWFRVWPNKIPQASQKEVQDRSTVWLEFARWSRFRRVTYFRAASGVHVSERTCRTSFPPFFCSDLPLRWNPNIVSPSEEDPLRLRFARISACYCAAYIRG